jgi:predicted nucleic acid-binding protein
VKPVLVDTSFLVALYNGSDRHHAVCVRVLDTLLQPLCTCEPVIAESCYMLRTAPRGVASILENVYQGKLQIPFLLSRSAESVQKLLRKYGDLPADFADACLVQMADELNSGDILTLDHHFHHYRWRKTKPFNLLIPLG